MKEKKMKIFPLVDGNGNLYSPIRQAATLAKYSRSPESALDLINKTPELGAINFQKRVVVEYGHNSVAELATIPVCFEGVSIIASKFLESFQRPACSEKSTRMQLFEKSQMYFPTEKIRDEFEDTFNKLYELYIKIYEWALKTNPCNLDSDLNIQRKSFDIARCVLPAGMLTNLCLVAYPRDLADLQKLLLSSSNTEFEKIGNELNNNLQEIGGPLIRHAEKEPWVDLWCRNKILNKPLFEMEQNVQLISCSYINQKIEENFLSYASDYYGMKPNEFVKNMNERPLKTEVPNVFKKMRISFDIYVDYGSFRDLQRHRNMNQHNDLLTVHYGYSIPEEIKNNETIHEEFCKLMDEIKNKIKLNNQEDWALQYMIPMSFIHKSCFDMDLKQLYYLVELRTKPEGHINYRKIAWDMYIKSRICFPQAMTWCRAINPE